MIALQAGVGDAAGIVIVSGTGSIAYGRNEHGEASRAGGWGYVLGDEGSGYWIGRLALRAVVRHADGRGRVTSLTPRLLAHFGVERAAELIHKVYHEEAEPPVDRGRGQIRAARAGRRRCCRDGHPESRCRRADDGRDGRHGAPRARRTSRSRSCSPGGMFHAVPWLCDQMQLLLPALARQSTVMRLNEEPALGAVRLALAEMHGGARLPVYRPNLT